MNMIYEINEQEFHAIPRISTIKSYHYQFLEQEIHGTVLSAILQIDLTYYNFDYKEFYTGISLPIELNFSDKKLNDLSIRSIQLDVVEGQGIQCHYTLVIDAESLETADCLSAEELHQAKEILKENYEDLLEANLDKRVDDYEEEVVACEEEVDELEEEARDELCEEEAINPIIIVEEPAKQAMKLQEDTTIHPFNFSHLQQSYQSVKIVYITDEKELNKLSVKYQVPLDELYASWDKNTQRVMIKNAKKC